MSQLTPSPFSPMQAVHDVGWSSVRQQERGAAMRGSWQRSGIAPDARGIVSVTLHSAVGWLRFTSRAFAITLFGVMARLWSFVAM